MPSDIHEAANTTKEGWIAWFCPLKLYRHYSGCRIWSGLLYRNYIKLYVSFCAARPGFVAYLFVVQYTTAVLYRCFYIRFVLPLISIRIAVQLERKSIHHNKESSFSGIPFLSWQLCMRCGFIPDLFRVSKRCRERRLSVACRGDYSHDLLWIFFSKGIFGYNADSELFFCIVFVQ